MNDLATRLRRLADTRRRGHSVHPDVLREAANAIDNLTAERDEARREADELRKETLDHGGAFGQFEREDK
jgi:hypothetical protein